LIGEGQSYTGEAKMKAIYFAAPVRINPTKALQLKEEFLHEATYMLREYEVHVESPHLKYSWINTHPDYTTTSDIELYAREQGIHLMEEYPLDALIALTTREEASEGMVKEIEVAHERDIPVFYCPYFTTKSGDIEVADRSLDELEEALQELAESG
jgi:hypothetical protein